MPQLDIFILSSLVIFTSISVLSLIFFMHTYIVPQIAASLKTRNILLNQKTTEKGQSFSEITQKKLLININKSLLVAIKNKLTRD